MACIAASATQSYDNLPAQAANYDIAGPAALQPGRRPRRAEAGHSEPDARPWRRAGGDQLGDAAATGDHPAGGAVGALGRLPRLAGGRRVPGWRRAAAGGARAGIRQRRRCLARGARAAGKRRDRRGGAQPEGRGAARRAPAGATAGGAVHRAAGRGGHSGSLQPGGAAIRRDGDGPQRDPVRLRRHSSPTMARSTTRRCGSRILRLGRGPSRRRRSGSRTCVAARRRS